MKVEAINKIEELVQAKENIFNVQFFDNSDTYTNDPNMKRLAPHVDRVKKINFTSLDSIVQALKREILLEDIAKPLFVNVSSYSTVQVFTTYRADNLERDYLYSAEANLPRPFDQWSYHEDAIIMLKSQFIHNDDITYLLDLLSRISTDDSVTSADSGVTQKVSATTGVCLKTYEDVKPRVKLAPFRTFLEVEQPVSEFILRVKPANKETGIQPQIGIIEADGGAWKLEAKKNVADYFREHLADLIKKGDVIVTE